MEKFQNAILVIVFGSVFLALGKIVLTPEPRSQSAIAFTFPADVPLIEWRSFPSSPLATLNSKGLKVNPGRLYRYEQQGQLLDIEMRYLINTNGGIKHLLQKYRSIPTSSGQIAFVQRQHQGVGFYSLIVSQRRAYLSACINPRGGSTVTSEQFNRNRDTYDLQWERLLPWLLGRTELRDKRCLWAHLSMPLESSSPELTYKSLEQVWFAWYQLWQSHFSKS